MSNGHIVKVYCPTIGKEGVIDINKIKDNTCPFCGCIITTTGKKEFFECDLKILQMSA